MTIQTINPATGKLVRQFDEFDSDQIESKLEFAYEAFLYWSETSFDERRTLMKKAADNLRFQARALGEIITLEMGKPISQSKAEVEKCALVCDYYAEHAEEFLSSRSIPTDADVSFVRYDPIGPVLAVMPWNFPFWQVYRFAAPTLMAGNVCVLKHASNVPQSALAIEKQFIEAGFPRGTFSTLLISAPTVKRVIEDRRVAAVTLTGSEPAGRQVAATAGAAIKKSVLELGGSDPFIVLADADIERAAKIAVLARTINTGQTCICAKRFIVDRAVAEEFVGKFLEKLNELKMGDPMIEETDIGPMARSDLREELHGQVIRTVEQGAKVVLGGSKPDVEGFYYPVTLLTDVDMDFVACAEETFGPVAPIILAQNEDEAIRIANHSRFGLGASIWTKDIDRAGKLAEKIEAGAVFVNGLVKSDPRLPFGGIKHSGYGRELGKEGIREFVNVKSVWMAKTD